MTDLKNAGQADVWDLLRFLRHETAGRRLRSVAASLLAGLSRGLLLTIFNTAAGGQGRIDLKLAGAFAATLAVHLATNFEAGRQSDELVRGLSQRIRLRICDKLVDAPLRLVETLDPGKIFAHIGWEVEVLARAASTFLTFFQSGVLLLFALGYLAWLSPSGLVFAVLTILLSAAAYYWQEHQAQLLYKQARNKEVEFFDAMYDLLHGFKEVKLGQAQQQDISAHVRVASDQFRIFSLASARLYRVSETTSHAFTFSLIAILVFVLPALVPGTSASIYKLLATILFVLGPAEQLISAIPSFSQATAALETIKRLEEGLGLGTAPPAGPAKAPPGFERITLSGVHFEFRGATAEESFDLGPVDLEIKRGETLLICGGNGAGKTTLLKLITGLYSPSSGTIFLDGRPITPANGHSYREMFAAVFSDVHLLRRLYGIADPDSKQVQALLTMLQIDQKTRLEDGRFTALNLSTGQRKRLAFAISRLRDRQIYVFDEFAADQDPAFRTFFYTVLLPDLKKQGKTVIAITHDDRWFGAGDRLVKLDYGVIVPAGPQLLP